jgi:hypothetical protein
LGKALGGSSNDKSSNVAPAPQAAKNLFQPDQIKQATDQYSRENIAKWNQINAGMGAGGGTGGPDVNTTIGNQANEMGTWLAGLNTDSGYGSDPMANLPSIFKAGDSAINSKYGL